MLWALMFVYGSARLKDYTTCILELCAEKEVQGYPTFQIFENGKFARAYNGGRTKDDFMNAVTGKTEL